MLKLYGAYINDLSNECNDNSCSIVQLVLIITNWIINMQISYFYSACKLNCLIKCTPSIINGKSLFTVIGAAN